MQPFDDYEIQPVYEDEEGNCHPCDEGEQSYYTLYGHCPEGGVMAIFDGKSREDCKDMYFRITGKIWVD